METNAEFHPTKSKYLVLTADYLIPCLIIVTIVAAWYVAFHTSIFAVREIHCTVDGGACSDPTMLAELAKYRGENVLNLDTKAIENHVTSADYTIGSASVTSALPGSLSVTLQSVSPVVALQVVGTTEWVVLDDKLRVIGTRTLDPSVPTLLVTSIGPLAVGQPIPASDIAHALELTRAIGVALPGVKAIELVDNSTVTLTLASGVQALLTTTKDINEQLHTLQVVLEDATMTTGIRTIDVRFTQPVLKP